jgi:hypothetical protein
VPRNPRLVDVAPTIFELALENLGLPSKEVAMVGDDPELDVGGAQAAGLRGFLVETGRYHPGAESPVRSDLVLESVAQSPEALDIQGSSGTIECGFLLANALAAWSKRIQRPCREHPSPSDESGGYTLPRWTNAHA